MGHLCAHLLVRCRKIRLVHLLISRQLNDAAYERVHSLGDCRQGFRKRCRLAAEGTRYFPAQLFLASCQVRLVRSLIRGELLDLAKNTIHSVCTRRQRFVERRSPLAGGVLELIAQFVLQGCEARCVRCLPSREVMHQTEKLVRSTGGPRHDVATCRFVLGEGMFDGRPDNRQQRLVLRSAT